MEFYRKEILENTKQFAKIIKTFEAEHLMTYGDSYKKPKEGDIPAFLAPYYNKRNVGFYKHTDGLADLESVGFVDKVTEIYKKLAPMYKFLLSASEKELIDRINTGGINNA